MTKYKVLKDYIHNRNCNLIKEGSEFNYDGHENSPSYPFISALTREGFIEEIPKQPKTVWDLKYGDEYYAIASDGFITTEIYRYDNSYEHNSRVDIGNAFITKEEAEKELARRKAKVILERDTKGFKPDWEKYNYGVEVYWDHCGKKLVYNWVELNDGTIRFKTDEDAQASIKAHEKEWKIYLGVEE